MFFQRARGRWRSFCANDEDRVRNPHVDTTVRFMAITSFIFQIYDQQPAIQNNILRYFYP